MELSEYQKSNTYCNGAADERFVVVSMLHLDKELLLLEVITLVSTFSDVNGFIDSASEVNQSITSLTTSQCLIATGHSAITMWLAQWCTE